MFKVSEMGVAIARMNKAGIFPAAIIATVVDPDDIGKRVNVNENLTAVVSIDKYDIAEVEKKKKRKALQDKLEGWLDEGGLEKKLNKAFAKAAADDDDEDSRLRGGKKGKKKRRGPKSPKCGKLVVIDSVLTKAEAVMEDPGDYDGKLVLSWTMAEV